MRMHNAKYLQIFSSFEVHVVIGLEWFYLYATILHLATSA